METLTNIDFDVVILGAGIQGAGVAQAAAARGWSVLVIEKQAQAAMGTSSKSSKLIHGGLRYLETMQLRLVRECLLEKQLLCRLAPALVKPARFIVPVYTNYKRSPFWVQLGLYLYKLLAWPAGKTVRGRLARTAWQEHRFLKQDKLRAIFEYEDAQTDDVLLTQAVLASAKKLGAEIRFNIQVEKIEVFSKNYKITMSNGEVIVSRSLVNATGPWVNLTAACIQADTVPTMPIDLVQGSHIVLNREALGCCYYLESPDDGRAMFVLPWKGQTMVGTTEKSFDGNPEDCVATDEEVNYLLNAYNHFFPDLCAGKDDILETFAGLRVLPREATSQNKRSRDTLFLQSDALPAYIAIYGGKLTAWRKSAEKVVQKLAKFLPKTRTLASTDELPLV